MIGVIDLVSGLDCWTMICVRQSDAGLDSGGPVSLLRFRFEGQRSTWIIVVWFGGKSEGRRLVVSFGTL